MAKRKIGFLPEEEEKEEKKVEIAVKNVDQEFKRMISYLELEEKIYLQELSLEQKIRKELVRLHKWIKKLQEKIEKRKVLMAKCQGYSVDFPKKSLELIDEIGELDHQIMPEAEVIFKEIGKHALPDVAELYKEMELSTEQVKHIRTLAMTLNSSLSNLIRPIQETVQSQQLEMMRRNLLMKHPTLR